MPEEQPAQKFDWKAIGIILALASGQVDVPQLIGLPNPQEKTKTEALWRRIRELQDQIHTLVVLMERSGIETPLAGPASPEDDSP